MERIIICTTVDSFGLESTSEHDGESGRREQNNHSSRLVCPVCFVLALVYLPWSLSNSLISPRHATGQLNEREAELEKE